MCDISLFIYFFVAKNSVVETHVASWCWPKMLKWDDVDSYYIMASQCHQHINIVCILECVAVV